jgi:hypothetical protein
MKLRGDRVPGRSGTLHQRTKKKRLKSGQIVEYPLVNGYRDLDNILHWFWHYHIQKCHNSMFVSTLSLCIYSTTSSCCSLKYDFQSIFQQVSLSLAICI